MNDQAIVLSPVEELLDQFRLSHVQSHHWGTFHGTTTVSVARKGHLMLGASGSGKSTLLDVSIALLAPHNYAHYNAAAAGGEKRDRNEERNLVTYVRGAYGKKTSENDELVRNYLREGPTWSAIAQQYSNSRGLTVTLARVFWIKSASTALSDVKDMFIVARRAFDLKELLPFAQSHFDERAFKAKLDDKVRVFTTFTAYSEALRHDFSIESDMALKLLVKTQSAKSQQDLSAFMRENMLDLPSTFEVAASLVVGFKDLQQAHAELEQARAQIECLKPAREAYEAARAAQMSQSILSGLLIVLDAYRDQQLARILAEDIREVDVRIAGFTADLVRKTADARIAEESLRSLRLKLAGIDGGRMESLLEDRVRLEDAQRSASAKRQRLEQACGALGWSVPDSAQAHEELLHRAQDFFSSAKSRAEQIMAERDRAVLRRGEMLRDRVSLQEQIEAMERQPSLMPPPKLRIREMICAGTDIPDSELPFAGELMQVRAEEQGVWSGAIERAMGGFARTMLGHMGIAKRVIAFMNENNLRGDIDFLRTPEVERELPSLPRAALANKIEVKGESRYYRWLKAHLATQFDHICVSTPEELERLSGRGLTPQGQVKAGRDHFRKYDHIPIFEKRNWVIGFNNAEKLAQCRREAQELDVDLGGLDETVTEWAGKLADEARLGNYCTEIRGLSWRDVDVTEILTSLRRVNEQIEIERIAHPEIDVIKTDIEVAEEMVQKRGSERAKAETELMSAQKDRRELFERREKLPEENLTLTIGETQRVELTRRAASVSTTLTSNNVGPVTNKMRETIKDEHHKLELSVVSDHNRVVTQFKAFNAMWSSQADLDASVEAASDFMTRLGHLEAEDLPRFRGRFMELLRKHSDEGVAAINTMLASERRTMLDRLDVVNAGLATTPFNQGTILQIKPVDRKHEDVTQFLAALREIMGMILSEDEAVAEEQYRKVNALVKRLGSEETKDLNWRRLVLDVRQHVSFIALELDDDGVEVDVYSSGQERSGGQQQKLAATLLASALRYQLGGREARVPRFGAVFLDEAFSNSDPEFTQLAMDVFKTFNFQVIMATPMKCVQAVETFIGGATMVTNETKKRSLVLSIGYREEGRVLDLDDQQRQSYLQAEESAEA